MNRFFLRLAKLTASRVMWFFILFWFGAAVLLTQKFEISRAGLLAFVGVTLVYSFFVAGWAMLRTYARLEGVLDEGEAPDGGLLLDKLPLAAVVLDKRGKVSAFNVQWLELFGLAPNHVRGKHYARFADPALRRHIERAQRESIPALGLALSARRPDSVNVFFRADIKPLGEGLLVTAFPAEHNGRDLPQYEDDRFHQLGIAAAGLLPNLVEHLRTAACEEHIFSPLVHLLEWLNDESTKPSTLDPAALLMAAARIVEPAFASRGVKLTIPPQIQLPTIIGHQPKLTYALVAMLFYLRDAAGPAGSVTIRTGQIGRDIEIAFLSPVRAATPPDSHIGLTVARQIAREHDGDLQLHHSENGDLTLLLHLPTDQPFSEK